MEQTTEEFRNIDGFDGYWIGNKGTVICKRRYREVDGMRHMKPWKRKAKAKEYLCVSLYVHGRKKNKDIHKLVAAAFVPNFSPHLFTEIHHKDDDTLNPAANNLEWCTSSYNQNAKKK